MKENSIITLAEEIATKAHKNQFRRDGKTLYITHPRAIVKTLKRYYSNPEKYLSAAWLHDVLEDTNLKLGDLLNKGIPLEVAVTVELLTKKEEVGYLQYILKIKENLIARIIKIVDMEDNLKTATGSQKAKYLLAIYILRYIN